MMKIENDINQNSEQMNDADQGDLRIHPFDPNSAISDQIRALYDLSFPDAERKPFEMIEQGREQGKMELFYATLDDAFAALIFIILGEPVDVLDYLAVDPRFQGKQIGSRILEWLKTERRRPFLVEIETTLADCDEQAIRRKQFYINADLKDCHEEISLFGVPMELLSWPKAITYPEYEAVMHRYFEGDLRRWLYSLNNQDESSKAQNKE